MKLCRLLGIVLVLAGIVLVVGPRLDVLAQEKKQEEKKKGEKKDAKDKEKGKETKKDKEASKETKNGDTKLEWKAFDKEFYQTLTTETKQKMKVMGMEVIQEQKQTFYIKWVPEKQKEGKNWVVTQKIVGVKMDIDIGGNKISYDSTAADQPNNPMTDFFKALLTLNLKFVINPDGMKIEKIEGNDEFVKSLGKANPQMEPLLKSILSKDALTKMAEPTLFAFPPGGDLSKKTWKNTSKLDLGPIGSYETKYEFKYDGKEGKLDKIGVKAEMTYAPPMDKGKLPFTIESGELNGKDGTGHALFDRTLGRFEEYKMTMKLEGNLKIDIGGMKTTVDLTQEQTATVKSSNEDPVAEAKKKKS
jgi:hypothetical protein